MSPTPVTDYRAHILRRTAVVGGCWLWLGGKNSAGYGQMKHFGKMRKVHRIAYELWRGPITPGLHLDHLCRNPACANPDHLEPVTPRENTLRGIGPSATNARATHCKSGHPLTPDNLVRGGNSSTGARLCKQCHRTWARQARARVRERVAIRATEVAQLHLATNLATPPSEITSAA